MGQQLPQHLLQGRSSGPTLAVAQCGGGCLPIGMTTSAMKQSPQLKQNQQTFNSQLVLQVKAFLISSKQETQ